MEEIAGQTLTQRELTFGEKAVGLSFNPGGLESVNNIKKVYADVIDQLNDIRTGPEAIDGDKARLIAVAITEAQTAQMWAVKAVTWNL